MIPPQELKKKIFTRSMRGYEPVEVDEHINFLVEKYTELFAHSDRLEKKLRLVAERISDIQREEAAIKSLAVTNQESCEKRLEQAESQAKMIIEDAKSQAQKITGEAKISVEQTFDSVGEKTRDQIRVASAKSEALLLSARTQCVRILNEFKKEVVMQRESLEKLKSFSNNFQTSLLTGYKEHIKLLNENRILEIDLNEYSDFRLLDSLMTDIKKDAQQIAQNANYKEPDFETDLNNLKPDKFIEKLNELVSIKEEEPVQSKIIENDDDVKPYVNAKTEPAKARVKPAEETYDEEKPIATYDSDDFKESIHTANQGTKQSAGIPKKDYDENNNKPLYEMKAAYKEVPEEADDSYENSDDSDYDDEYEEDSENDYDDSPEELPDDYEEPKGGKKGFFSFLKAGKSAKKEKQSNSRIKAKNDYSDDAEENESIFDDLEDDE